MNILYVYDGDWPRGATRVAKQTRSLAHAGHDVRLVSRNGLASPRSEKNQWMTIDRLPSFGSGAFNYAMNFPFFLNPVWLVTILLSARRHRADCIVVSDLPLGPSVIWVARLLNIPVYYDMAEVYPEFLRDLWAFDDLTGLDRIVRNPRAADMVERYVLKRVHTTFVVSEESRTRCIDLGVPVDRVVVVGNTPEAHDAFDMDVVAPNDLAEWVDRPKLLFVGIIIGDRGVGLAVEAMQFLRQTVPDALLVVVGDGRDRENVEALVSRLDLHEHVAMLGWKQPVDLPAYYRHCELGLLPFLDGRHLHLTLANKLFDYMAAGLPVVAADLPPMRRILAETGAGVLHRAGDPEALAAAAAELLLDEDRRHELGQAGLHGVSTRYNWRSDEARFLDAFSK